MTTAADSPSLIPGRSCDGCTLCCKLLGIAAFDKPRLEWCAHCDVGAGCKVYQQRPQECRDFFCAYRYSPAFGEEWRPADCLMMVNYEGATNRINVLVDPEKLDAWRAPRFYRQIKAFAAEMLRNQGHLVVWEGLAAIVVLPDRDVHLGELNGRNIIVMGRNTPNGPEYDAVALAADDPRLKALTGG